MVPLGFFIGSFSLWSPTACHVQEEQRPLFSRAQSQRNETSESNAAGAAHQLSEEAAQASAELALRVKGQQVVLTPLGDVLDEQQWSKGPD